MALHLDLEPFKVFICIRTYLFFLMYAELKTLSWWIQNSISNTPNIIQSKSLKTFFKGKHCVKSSNKGHLLFIRCQNNSDTMRYWID